MVDAVNRFMNISNKRYSNSKWLETLKAENPHIPLLKEKEYYLATIHRAENTDDLMKLQTIFTALERLDKPVLIPFASKNAKIGGKIKYFVSKRNNYSTSRIFVNALFNKKCLYGGDGFGRSSKGSLSFKNALHDAKESNRVD